MIDALSTSQRLEVLPELQVLGRQAGLIRARLRQSSPRGSCNVEETELRSVPRTAP